MLANLVQRIALKRKLIHNVCRKYNIIPAASILNQFILTISCYIIILHYIYLIFFSRRCYFGTRILFSNNLISKLLKLPPSFRIFKYGEHLWSKDSPIIPCKINRTSHSRRLEHSSNWFGSRWRFRDINFPEFKFTVNNWKPQWAMRNDKWQTVFQFRGTNFNSNQQKTTIYSSFQGLANEFRILHVFPLLTYNYPYSVRPCPILLWHQ